jgi:uncharacterized protein (DUF2141 family)
MITRKTITIGLLALFMGISSSTIAQDETTKKGKQIVRNGVIYTSTETGPNSLSLQVNKLKSDAGFVMISLQTSDKKQIAYSRAKIIDKVCTIKIDSLPSGKYAIQYYHDANNNGKIDTGNFGIPEEGYGSSNDARGFMGPPDFEDMIFELKGDLTIKMKTVN